MKSLISAVVVGICLFALSAGTSWLMFADRIAEAEEKEGEEIERLIEPVDLQPEIAAEEKLEAMPVALRPDPPVTIEAVTDLARSIMKKEKAVFDAEQRLRKEENRLGLLFEDLKREREELEAFSAKIDNKIKMAREAVEFLKLENQSLDEKTKKLSSLQRKTGKKPEDLVEDELARKVKMVKPWFYALDDENAAGVLKEIVDRGDTLFAARLLGSLEDRQISKVLESLDDTPLVAEIIETITKSPGVEPSIRKLR